MLVVTAATKVRRGLLLAIALATISLVTSAFAQAPIVTVKLVANQVLVNDSKESLVPAAKVKPGDVIEYKAVYTNSGKGAAQNVAATLPVPVGLGFLAESAQPAAELASLDGKTFKPVPLTRPTVNANGMTEEKMVPPSEYRALRWQIDELAPGGAITVALRARVLTNEPAK